MNEGPSPRRRRGWKSSRRWRWMERSGGEVEEVWGEKRWKGRCEYEGGEQSEGEVRVTKAVKEWGWERWPAEAQVVEGVKDHAHAEVLAVQLWLSGFCPTLCPVCNATNNVGLFLLRILLSLIRRSSHATLRIVYLRYIYSRTISKTWKLKNEKKIRRKQISFSLKCQYSVIGKWDKMQMLISCFRNRIISCVRYLSFPCLLRIRRKNKYVTENGEKGWKGKTTLKKKRNEKRKKEKA